MAHTHKHTNTLCMSSLISSLARSFVRSLENYPCFIALWADVLRIWRLFFFHHSHHSLCLISRLMSSTCWFFVSFPHFLSSRIEMVSLRSSMDSSAANNVYRLDVTHCLPSFRNTALIVMAIRVCLLVLYPTLFISLALFLLPLAQPLTSYSHCYLRRFHYLNGNKIIVCFVISRNYFNIRSHYVLYHLISTEISFWLSGLWAQDIQYTRTRTPHGRVWGQKITELTWLHRCKQSKQQNMVMLFLGSHI